MEMTDGTPRATRQRQRFIVAAAIAVAACRTPTPQLSFLDDESSLSFTHPPRWSVAFAEQGGLRYRYLTAPKVEGDKESLSITLIPSTASVSASALAQSYLSDASGVVEGKGPTDSTEWSFADSSGVASRLRIAPSEEGRFFGAWVRGPESAMSRYKSQVDTLLGSLRVERPAGWEEERFAGMVARAPRSFTRGSRLSSVKTASMQFRSPALAVEKGTATIHGFVTVSREQVPPPGDLEAFNKMVKDRASDTVALLEHRPWPSVVEGERAAGYVDYMRSGTTLTSTRIRRWITVKNGVGLILSCEARADAFDRLDPWCHRMASAARLE